MGLINNILGADQRRSADDYVELDLDDVSESGGTASMHVHIAEISDQTSTLDIKDAVYDGDVVIADITRLRTTDKTTEHIVDELRQVAQEVGGDIVQKGDDQIIITPTGISIGREKLGR